ncbi:hypothetical protein K474DRAFT_1709808 [Panus rudis PR-1116 ss-1]|nr:hypothetical protein K474DRAFT_1709808 [Panus rudis PR-1116 ss-1]
MPNLHTLHLSIQTHLTPVPHLEIYNQDEQIHLPLLQDVAISNVHPRDPFFASLPSTLTSLSIRDTPRYYLTHDLPPGNTLVGVGELRSLFHPHRFPPLQHLEIAFVVISDDSFIPEAVYDSVVQSCPNLRSLEINCYHDPLINPSLKRTLRALNPLKNLRTLRLNLDFPNIDRLEPLQVHGGPGDDDEPTTTRLRLYCIAKGFPLVHTVAVLTDAVYGVWSEINYTQGPIRGLDWVSDDFSRGYPSLETH